MNDPTIKEDSSRTCANCACILVKAHMLNKMETQAFCRRNPPLHQIMRVEVPRMKHDGSGPVIHPKTGKPIMEPGEQEFYLYPPTMPHLVCFDGWRPRGTLPGDTIMSVMGGHTAAAMERLIRDMATQALDAAVDDTAPKN